MGTGIARGLKPASEMAKENGEPKVRDVVRLGIRQYGKTYINGN